MAPQVLGSPPTERVRDDIKGAKIPLAVQFVLEKDLKSRLAFFYRENNLAKLVSVAEEILKSSDPPIEFPETVPQTDPSRGIYRCRDEEFWTCGFFPGSLYCLLERMRKYPAAILANLSAPDTQSGNILHTVNNRNTYLWDIVVSRLTELCQKWSAPLHSMSSRTDTHDLGFIVQPALRRDWELFGHKRSLGSLLTAAESLASRFDERVGAIRSWDWLKNAHNDISSMDDDFLVIVDSLCNLDLLYYASDYLQDSRLRTIATTHATTLLSSHLRKESGESNGVDHYSSYHVVNFCPSNNGLVKKKLTAQGYSDTSTWARGQAWGILGYAQTFSHTKRREFLDASMGLAEYFISALELAPAVVVEQSQQGAGSGCGRYVPLWDFAAPITNITGMDGVQAPLRDVSAGMIAANGMLLLYGQLTSLGEYAAAKRYFEYAMRIANDTVALAYNRDEMCLKIEKHDGNLQVKACGLGSGRFDAILERSTANFNQHHWQRYWNHGLVYADYYFLELGNRLCDMGLI